MKPGDSLERWSFLNVPGAEPREIVAAVTEGRTGTDNVNGAGGFMDENDPHLAGDLVTDEERDVRLPIAIKVAALIERVHAIVPFILSLELSTECLKSPRRNIPNSVDGERISRLPERRGGQLGKCRDGDESSEDAHVPYVAPPNGTRLSCGAELEYSQMKDYPRKRGAGSFRRLLGACRIMEGRSPASSSAGRVLCY